MYQGLFLYKLFQKHFSTEAGETHQNLWSIQESLQHCLITCLLISSCVCRSASSMRLNMLSVPSELPWGLFISSFVCLFVCAIAALCSWANKAPFCPDGWYGRIKACDQPEHFNNGCGAGVDRLAQREGWHAAVTWCLQHASVVAHWLHCRLETGWN